MNAAQTAEAFRILGVHSSRRLQLAESLLAVNAPWTLKQLAVASGIPSNKIYYVADALRDAGVLQVVSDVREPVTYGYSEEHLIKAIRKKANEARDQILNVLQEATQ